MKTVQEQIAVMQAFVAGKKIEYYSRDCGKWLQADQPAWNWVEADYRIKVESGVFYRNLYKSGRWGDAWNSRAQAITAARNGSVVRAGVKFIEAPCQD